MRFPVWFDGHMHRVIPAPSGNVFAVIHSRISARPASLNQPEWANEFGLEG